MHISNHSHTHQVSDSLRSALFLNLGFTLIEIIGGFWTGSLAILSDAIHDLGDSIALGIAWYLEHIAGRKEDKNFSYGYRRFSLLGALISAVILVSGAVLIFSEAIPRLWAPTEPYAPGMLVIAIFGVVINSVAVLRLRNGENFNARMIFWHLLEDVLGWLAILLVSLILLFVDLPILDPLLSIGISLFVLINVFRNLRRTLRLFLQAVPDQVDMDDLKDRILAIEKVVSTHHNHVWSLDGEHHVLSSHIIVEQDTSRQEVQCIKTELRTISEELDLIHTTIEIEYGDEGCGMQPGTGW